MEKTLLDILGARPVVREFFVGDHKIQMRSLEQPEREAIALRLEKFQDSPESIKRMVLSYVMLSVDGVPVTNYPEVLDAKKDETNSGLTDSEIVNKAVISKFSTSATDYYYSLYTEIDAADEERFKSIKKS